jgi:RimJ/RimL family protein N-acetyltransferase
MEIRTLLPEDASRFQAIRLQGLLEIPSAFSSSHAEEVDTPLPIIAQRLETRPEGAVLGAFEDDALVGVIGVQREGQRQLAHKAFIWGMYVHPDHRLKGVGRALVSRALDIAAGELGVRSVNLGVNTRNSAAVALYRSMGFQAYGTEIGFLRINGELHDQHLMSRIVGDT